VISEVDGGITMRRVEAVTVAGVSGGDVDLLRSHIQTDMVTLGDDGLINFRFRGLERIDPDDINGTVAPIANTYSAIDTVDGVLSGEILSTFEFTPPSPGTYTFDLIQSDNLTALDDTTATLEIHNLPSGFTVCFHGVAEEGGADVLRLIISDHCVPEPSTVVGLLGCLGCMVFACRRQRSLPT